MLDSYFFVPGDNQRFLSKIKKINADYFVIDLEESVQSINKQKAFEIIKSLEFDQNVFVRIPFAEKVYTNQQLTFLIEKFNGSIVIPKFQNHNDIERVIDLTNNEVKKDFIILIEDPTAFIELPNVLKKYSTFIHGICFGSHDFCAKMGSKHNLEHLKSYKEQLILYAKGFGIKYIDGVDVNIRDLSEFERECVFAFNSGADGKSLIHPDQLKRMYEIQYFSSEELSQMKEVYKKKLNIKDDSFAIIEHNGKIYEKPHIMLIERILNKFEKHINH